MRPCYLFLEYTGANAPVLVLREDDNLPNSDGVLFISDPHVSTLGLVVQQDLVLSWEPLLSEEVLLLFLVPTPELTDHNIPIPSLVQLPSNALIRCVAGRLLISISPPSQQLMYFRTASERTLLEQCSMVFALQSGLFVMPGLLVVLARGQDALHGGDKGFAQRLIGLANALNARPLTTQ